MLKGSNSVRVIVLAALVLAVAFSSTIGSRLPGWRAGVATTSGKQSRHRAVEQQKLNSAWQAQISSEQTQLQQAQQQQEAQQQAASSPSTLTPPTPTRAPTAAPAPASSSTGAATAPTGGSVQADIQAAFSPLGPTAVQWGFCIAQHESGDNPNAIQPGPGGAEGLFQFEPSTWAATPQGLAGDSIFDPVAQSQAAAAFYARGNYSAWTTNAAYCSMYD